MPEPIVSLSDVSLRKPGALILRRASLELGPGEVAALYGANGSGKTTLLRVIATLLRPSSGSVTIFGVALGTAEVEAIRPRIGLIGHEPALLAQLTVAENLALVAKLARKRRHAAGEVLESVGLAGAADRRVAHCSNGMKRRAEFARLLLCRPQLALLDEAHVGLDPAASRLLESVVQGARDRGGAAILVSHERERVGSLADRAFEISDGVIHEVPP